jgi:hypothetical protein
MLPKWLIKKFSAKKEFRLIQRDILYETQINESTHVNNVTGALQDSLQK